MRDELSEHVLHFAECFGRECIPELGYIVQQYQTVYCDYQRANPVICYIWIDDSILRT